MHQWVIATTVEVEPDRADEAHVRERLTLTGKLVVAVLDLYCDHCRRPYDPARKDEVCALGPQHSGGPRRQPELPPPPDDFDEGSDDDLLRAFG